MTTLVRTAGMVNGTPDWQLDRAYETDTMQELEKAYKEDDLNLSLIGSYFSDAKYHIGQAVDILCKAADEADKCGKAEPLDDLIDKLGDDFKYELDSLLRKWKEGA